MEVILKEDLKTLGYKNDIVNVKPGYARNYLIPQGLALIANDSNKKRIKEEERQASHKAAKLKQDAEELGKQIAKVDLKIGAKVGESGKIFGSITALQLSEALKNNGFNIDRKKIKVDKDIKEAGTHEAVVNLHKEVQQTIQFEVVAE